MSSFWSVFDKLLVMSKHDKYKVYNLNRYSMALYGVWIVFKKSIDAPNTKAAENVCHFFNSHTFWAALGVIQNMCAFSPVQIIGFYFLSIRDELLFDIWLAARHGETW